LRAIGYAQYLRFRFSVVPETGGGALGGQAL
jgi:hypothetical protein